MTKGRKPLTDLERQKAHNIREKGAAGKNDSARDIMKTKDWKERNTHGSLNSPKPKSK